MKKVHSAQLISNELITDKVYRIILQCKEALACCEAGQFVNVYLNDKSMLLPRPISICLAEPDRLTLIYRVVGDGTRALAGYQEGEFISISTPLGHGYDIDAIFRELYSGSNEIADKIAITSEDQEPKVIALIAGGMGIPPMLELSKTIRNRLTEVDNTIRLIAVVGFQKEAFLIDEIREFCDEVVVATEDGSLGFRGNLLEMMVAQRIRVDYVLSCGPKPMLAALAKYCDINNIPFQVSLEERMGCGYGACVGCVCKTKEIKEGLAQVSQKKVCMDGPVFFGNEVVWDE